MKNHIISQELTLLEALSCINSLAPDPLVLFVVDGENHMVGTLTDGDSRRALIKGASVNDKVEKIMHRNFNYMKVEDSQNVQEIKAISPGHKGNMALLNCGSQDTTLAVIERKSDTESFCKQPHLMLRTSMPEPACPIVPQFNL